MSGAIGRDGRDGRTSGAAEPERRAVVPFIVAAVVCLVMVTGGFMYVRANASTNKVALASRPKAVTVVEARHASFRPSRKYVGTVQPWIEAKVGPQLTAAYVDTVLVRPGAAVKRGQVLATLDCRNVSAASQAVSMQARALEAEQEALTHQATRVTGLLEGGFVSPNEAEQRNAQSLSKQAELLASKAKILRSSLEVQDCVLRAPFDGEVADRTIDPGAFVRPGMQVVSVIDRRTARVAADVPETDFDAVAPGTPVRIHLLATGRDLGGVIARRSPSADASTRTIHCEIDVADPERRIPVGTTAEIAIDVGEPRPACELPLLATSIRGSNATLFTVEGNAAKKCVVPVIGEREGRIFVDDRALTPGVHVVTEGRSTVRDGDAVIETIDTAKL